MRIPAQPPPSNPGHSFHSDDIDRFFKLLNVVKGPLVHGKYLHWDRVRRRKTPQGFSHEEWWAALKFRRNALYTETPLRDKQAKPFVFANIDSIVQRLHEIDMSIGGHVAMTDPIANRDLRDQFYVSSLMEEAITSSQLEGAQTTRQVAKEMLRSGRKPNTLSERMILNNYRTMRLIDSLRDKPLSRELILEVHSQVTKGTLGDAKSEGRLRNESDGRVMVMNEDKVLHVPPDPDSLEKRLEDYCAFANGEIPATFIHPVLRGILLHFWLAYDHPFVDGNGRTARALFYWSMLRQGYRFFEFVTISKILLNAPAQYARSFLYTETDENDLTYFIDYQLDVMLRGIDELKKYIDRKTKTIARLEQQLKGMRTLNPRQRSLMSHALRHPRQIYTFESHRSSHDITYQTSRTDLMALEQKGYLDAQRVGRKWEFRPVSDLEKRLMESM